MKKLGILLFLSMLFISCKDKEVHPSKLQERNGLVYEINQKKEFTGISIATYRNGNTIKTSYKKGKKDGLTEMYSKNGQLLTVKPYKNGKMEGTFLQYSSLNGQLINQKVYKNDILIDDISIDWETGKKRKREIFEKFKFIQSEKEMIFYKITLKYDDKEEITHISVGNGDIQEQKFPLIKNLSYGEQSEYLTKIQKTKYNHMEARMNYLGYEYNDGQWIAYMKYMDENPVYEYQNDEHSIKMYHYYTESTPVEDSIINVKSREKIIDSLKKITTDKFWDHYWEE